MTCQETLGRPLWSSSLPSTSSFGTVGALRDARTHLRPSVASGDQLQRSSADSAGVRRTTHSGCSRSTSMTSNLERWLVRVSKYARPPERTNGRCNRLSTYSPARPPSTSSCILSTTGKRTFVDVPLPSREALCSEEQDACGPPSACESQSAAHVPGIGRGEREARLGSDNFVVESATMLLLLRLLSSCVPNDARSSLSSQMAVGRL